VEITVNIKAPELTQAIHVLAQALSVKWVGGVDLSNADDLTVKNGVVQPPVDAKIIPLQQTTPVQQPTAVPTAPTIQNQAPVQPQAPQQPTAVPTSAPTYDLNQLAVAATQLVDAGRMADIQQLIASFGVPALTALPQEQYGAFATKLRELGAKI
jgi:type IV secretory pathway VirB10-like protein